MGFGVQDRTGPRCRVYDLGRGVSDLGCTTFGVGFHVCSRVVEPDKAILCLQMLNKTRDILA